MMADQPFEDFQRRIQELYQSQQYDQAYALAEHNANAYPEQTPIVNYWRVCMAVRTGKQAEALRLLYEMLDQRLLVWRDLAAQEPLPAAATKQRPVRKAGGTNQEQQLKDQEQLFPLITLRSKGGCQDDEHPCPLLVALHGNGSSAQTSVDFWKPAASAGWLVGIPQSSQAMWKDAYVWSRPGDRPCRDRAALQPA